MQLRGRSLLFLVLFSTQADCAGRRSPDSAPITSATCGRAEVMVRGAGSEVDGIGRFVATSRVCESSWDTLAVGTLSRLLFSGVPESPQATALIADPEGARRDQPSSIRRLLGHEGMQFILESTAAADGGTLFRVNLAGLRVWLERNGLAMRFGLP